VVPPQQQAQARPVQRAHPRLHVQRRPPTLHTRTSRKFARKARAYRRAYREGVGNALSSIEYMVQTFKTHRNAIDFAFKFITDT
jgi:hypothetical protein